MQQCEFNKASIENFALKITLLNHRLLKIIIDLQKRQNASVTILQYEENIFALVDKTLDKLKSLIFSRSTFDQSIAQLKSMNSFNSNKHNNLELSNESCEALLKKLEAQQQQLKKLLVKSKNVNQKF